MLVVADSSPLIVLVNIGHIEILQSMFGQILVPPAVGREILSDQRSVAVREYFAAQPSWLKIQQPQRLLSFLQLHQGEIEAMSLALELKADLLLVDDRKAYQQAIRNKINAIGTVRVLEMGAERRLLELGDAFARLKLTDFWISHSLLDERLRQHKSTMSRQEKNP